VLQELEESQLVRILIEPRNALTRQYSKLFEMEGSEIEFREEALREVAHRAMERKTGARGLRSILETALLDTMYELPSLNKVSRVLVDAAAIRGESPPLLIYHGGGNIQQAASD